MTKNKNYLIQLYTHAITTEMKGAIVILSLRNHGLELIILHLAPITQSNKKG